MKTLHLRPTVIALALQTLLRPVAFDGGPGDGGDGKPPAISPEVQALITQHVETAVSGLKAKNSELIGKIKQKDTDLARFDGIDPDAVKNILAKFSSDEEAGLIAKGDIEAVMNKRTERMQADWQKKLDKQIEQTNKIQEANKRLSQRAVASEIVKAASKAGALPEAMEDITLRANGMWTVNEDGDVIARKDGETVLGKDGKTALSPIEWAESLRENAPHLWPKAQGSNAPGSGAPAKGGFDYSKLDPATRITKAREAGLTT